MKFNFLQRGSDKNETLPPSDSSLCCVNYTCIDVQTIFWSLSSHSSQAYVPAVLLFFPPHNTAANNAQMWWNVTLFLSGCERWRRKWCVCSHAETLFSDSLPFPCLARCGVGLQRKKKLKYDFEKKGWGWILTSSSSATCGVNVSGRPRVCVCLGVKCPRLHLQFTTTIRDAWKRLANKLIIGLIARILCYYLVF